MIYRSSQLFIPTLREDPADAESPSHRLLLRAGLVRQVDVGIAKQRCQVVGVGSHPRVLEVDHVELAVVHHQVAAVIVAMAEDARLAGKLGDDRGEFLAKRAALIIGERHAAIRLEEMLGEEIEFPRQLLDVERDAIREVLGRGEFLAALLEGGDERNRLPVERRVLRCARGAKMGLEGHVAKVLQRQQSVLVRVTEDRRNRQLHALKQVGDMSQEQAYYWLMAKSNELKWRHEHEGRGGDGVRRFLEKRYRPGLQSFTETE